MVFPKTEICPNEPHYVMVHPVLNIMTARVPKGRQNEAIMFPSDFFFINCWKSLVFIYHMLEKDYYKHKMRNVGVWLSCYGYIFAIFGYLTTVTQCLTKFFFFFLCVIEKISPT